MTNTAKNLLKTCPNPYRNKAYVISIVQEVIINRHLFLFGIRYVPDKLSLDKESLVGYLEQCLSDTFSETEKLAHDALEDIMDLIIPKWIEVHLSQEENQFGQNVVITLEDKQPNWENESLLKRLPVLF